MEQTNISKALFERLYNSMTNRELAKVLGVSTATIAEMVIMHRIQRKKTGRKFKLNLTKED